MILAFVYILFMLSVAFASAGVILSVRLKNKYNPGLFSTLLYFQVFIFTFGFYGIWGQLLIKTFLSDYVSLESIARFTDISVLLGLPFIVFAWLMLLKFSVEVSGRKSGNWQIFWFLIINFLVLIAVGYFISTNTGIKPKIIVKYYFIVLNFIYTIISSLIILYAGKTRLLPDKNENRLTAFALSIIMCLQCSVLYLYENESAIGLVFILLFFSGNAFLPVWISYGTVLVQTPGELQVDLSFEDFCKKYEVSPRESDIIREICNGLSNKEISDKLFISLQTVKDHTHRIYIKTNVRSRAQLMNQVKGLRSGT